MYQETLETSVKVSSVARDKVYLVSYEENVQNNHRFFFLLLVRMNLEIYFQL